MARIEYNRHKRVGTTPDDGVSDIQIQSHWNGDSHAQTGVLGFDESSETLIASGVLSPANTQTLIVAGAESGTSDDLDTLTITDYTENDIVKLKSTTGDTITVKHGTGNIFLKNDKDIVLSDVKEMILRFDGTNWQEVVSTDIIMIAGVATEVFDY